MLKLDNNSNKEMIKYTNEKLKFLLLRLIDLRNTIYSNLLNESNQKIIANKQRALSAKLHEEKSRNVVEKLHPTMSSSINSPELRKATSSAKFFSIQINENAFTESKPILKKNLSQSYFNHLIKPNLHLTKEKSSHNNKLSSKSIERKYIFYESNKTVKMTRPKTTESYNLFLCEKLFKKMIDFNDNGKKYSLRNRTLQTIDSKNNSIYNENEIVSLENRKLGFLSEKNRKIFSNYYKSAMNKSLKLDSKKTSYNKETNFKRTNHLSVVNIKIDGNHLKLNENQYKNFPKFANNDNSKFSLKNFPSLTIKNKEFINIKYRQINHLNKMKRLTKSQSIGKPKSKPM